MFNFFGANCMRQIGAAALKRAATPSANLLLRQSANMAKANPFDKGTKSGGVTLVKAVLFGTAAGAAFGTSMSMYEGYKLKNLDTEYRQTPPQVLDELPPVHITKRYVNPNDTSGLEIVLFQFQTCPFCCKVRAFLNAKGISYSVVEVDAVLRQDIKWSNSKKVPTLLVRQKDGRWLQLTDSSAIISLIATYLYENRRVNIDELASYYPNVSFVDDNKKRRDDVLNKYFLMFKDRAPKNYTKEEQEKERKWRMWVDNHLVHLISPNCYRTFEESLETFEWFSDAGQWDKYFPVWERNLMVYGGAVAMFGIGKMLKHRHNLSDDVRSHIYNALNKWTDELEKRKSLFFGGKQPNLADLAVFGVLNSMEGCLAFKDCLDNTNIGTWFGRMKKFVEKQQGALV